MIGVALAFACAAPSEHRGALGAVSVQELLAEHPQAIEVRGLDRTVTQRLARLAPNDSVWPTLVSVFVEQAAVDSSTRPSNTPSVIGRYSLSGDRVRFEPRFPFDAGVAYRVEVDTAALMGGSSEGTSTTLVHRFAIPSVERARTTRVVGVYPSSSQLPANLLRWYIETSAPMEVGNALAHIRLLDESGREVQGAFLAMDQELWDPARRRITLLLDPGRVKRGVRTNLEQGAPLVAGRRYRLVIDADWKDGAGAALASGFELAFEAVRDDRASPDPAHWRLTPPQSGTRAALRVAFGESLDHALAGRLIEVLDARGVPVPGSVEVVANDSTWAFSPLNAWATGEYTLRVGGALEDVAGNNVARVFDVDPKKDSVGVDRDVGGSTRSVRFRIL